MKTRLLESLVVFSAFSLAAPGVVTLGRPDSAPSQTVASRLVPGFGTLPLAFEPNRGQVSDPVKFLTVSGEISLFLSPKEVVWVLPARTAGTNASDLTALRMRLAGAAANPRMTGEVLLPGVSHYMRGSNRRHWQRNVPRYGRVRFHSVYPGIDLVFHGKTGRLEYDFEVGPGTDPQAIRMTFAGAGKISLSPAGDLVLQAGEDPITLQAPVVYQQTPEGRRLIGGGYRLLSEREVGFSLQAYDRNRLLFIDPVLSYSTVFGGASTDQAFGIALDSAGYIYVAGTTLSRDFPTKNPYQAAANRGADASRSDAFVAKLTPDGTNLVYSTYLGGSETERVYGLAIDSSGNAYIAGVTFSSDFPTKNPFQAATAGKEDAFIAKLNSQGVDLLFASYLGGSEWDRCFSVAVDTQGRAYLAGATKSTNFPTPNGWKKTAVAAVEAFAARVKADGSGLEYGTYLGGSADDYGQAVAVDAAGNAYVTGYTSSSDFPVEKPIQAHVGTLLSDVFVTKLDPTGSAAAYSTFIGGLGSDMGYGIAVDGSGCAYITGLTGSAQYPTTKDAFQTAFSGFYNDAFVSKLNAAGSGFVYSTYLGGSSVDETGYDIVVDSAGSAYVVGEVVSLSGYENESQLPIPRTGNFPLADPIQTRLLGQTVTSGTVRWFRAIDAFVSKLDPAGKRLVFSTYMGGHDPDTAKGVAVDAAGNIYVAGTTESGDFPSTPAGIKRGTAAEAFLLKIAPVSSPGGFVAGVPALPWTSYVLSDANGNGRPDADDQPVYGRREGTSLAYVCPAIPNSCGKGTFELSNPHPVTGVYQTANARWRQRASDATQASAGPGPAFTAGVTPATFSGAEFMFSLSATVTRYSEQLRAVAGLLQIEKTGTDGSKTTARLNIEARDSNQDGVSEGVRVSGNVDAVLASSGFSAQAAVPVQMDLPLTYFDVNGDGRNDYVSTSWTTVGPLLSSLGISLPAAIFVPLADTNGDGTPDSPARDFNGDGKADLDLLVPAFVAGTANPAVEHKLHFAQFGKGAAGSARIDSEIILFNLDKSSAANAHIEIRDDAGQLWNLNLNGQSVPGQSDRVIPAGGLLALKTDSTGDVKGGSVMVTANRPLAGVVVFGGTLGVAGVGSSAPMESGFIAPVESKSTEVNTGIAVMNLEASAAALEVEALDSSATVLARAALTLPALGHRAFFLTELAWEPPINPGQFTGLLRVSASRRIAATVLQTRPGEMATMPVGPNLTVFAQNRAAWATATPEDVLHRDRRLYFAHFGDGTVGGVRVFSQIVLANADPLRAASARILVRDDAGNPLRVDFNGQEVPGQTDIVVPPGGLTVLTTDGAGSLVSGSVTVESDQLLNGVIVLGGTVGVAGVGSSPELTNGLLAPVQRNAASGRNTGVALMNLEATTLQVDLELVDPAGSTLATARISLAANGHRALFVNEVAWDRSVDLTNFQGLLGAKAAGRLSGTVLQTESNSFATMPVAPKLR